MLELRELSQKDRNLLKSVDDQIIASKQEMNLLATLAEEIFLNVRQATTEKPIHILARHLSWY